MRRPRARMLVAATAMATIACSTPQGAEPLSPDAEPPDCAAGETYPQPVTEPMALGETMAAYAWPEAVDLASGRRADLDLGTVPCNTDDDIDWSPFDVLLFISVPAW